MYCLNKWRCDIFCSRICFLSVPQGFRSDCFLWHPELPFFTKARRRHPVYQTQDATSTDLQMQSSEIWAKSFKATCTITSVGFLNDYSLLMSTDVYWCLLMSAVYIWAHSPCLSFWKSTSHGKSQASPTRNPVPPSFRRRDQMWPDVTLARRPWRGQGTGRWSDQGEAQSGEIHLHLGGSIDGVRNGF